MYDIAFNHESEMPQINVLKWFPSTILPEVECEYLVVLKGQPRPLFGFYHKKHWYYLTGYELKEGVLQETFDDFEGKIELTHWAYLPSMPRD